LHSENIIDVSRKWISSVDDKGSNIGGYWRIRVIYLVVPADNAVIYGIARAITKHRKSRISHGPIQIDSYGCIRALDSLRAGFV